MGLFWLTDVTRHVGKRCRAVLLPRFGGPEVLELQEHVIVPPLRPNEVLVHARAVSINPLDISMRSGYGRSMTEPFLPLILGRDISGYVVAKGISVLSVSVGMSVYGTLHPTAVRGTYTDFAILGDKQVATKPEPMSYVDACAIPFTALTAWQALETAKIEKGQRVLVMDGGEAVGFSAIQLAVAAGCHVSVTCRGESVEHMLAAGAEQAVVYTTEDGESSIEGYFDAVLDTIGRPETETMGINLLKRGGHYVTLQGEDASYADRYGMRLGIAIAKTVLQRKQLQYRLTHGIDYQWNYMRDDPKALNKIRILSETGKLKVPVGKTYPIAEAREAHVAVDKGSFPGKVVLTFD